jgi:hypothetical protein
VLNEAEAARQSVADKRLWGLQAERWVVGAEAGERRGEGSTVEAKGVRSQACFISD